MDGRKAPLLCGVLLYYELKVCSLNILLCNEALITSHQQNWKVMFSLLGLILKNNLIFLKGCI